MRYYLTQDHFHYDDSGYYGYILFSGTNAELHQLLNELGRGDKEHGFGWHRWGRSFRPANNGIVYDYYIRLRSRTEVKPNAEVVDEFLKKTLPPRESLKGETESPETTTKQPQIADSRPAVATPQTENEPPLWASQLLNHVEALRNQPVEAFAKKVSEELLQLRSEVGDFSALQSEIRRLEADLEQTRTELSEKEADLEAKEEEIETLRNAPRAGTYDQIMQEERDKAEKAADKLRGEKRQLERDLTELKVSLREAKSDRDNWENQFKELSESIAETAEEEVTTPAGESDDAFENNFSQIVEGAFPQLELLPESIDRLNHVPHLRPIMKLLHDVHVRKLRGEKIPDTDWNEVRFSKSWRLYFCTKSNLPNDRRVALIGNKNSQKKDIRWLKANPPESCI